MFSYVSILLPGPPVSPVKHLSRKPLGPPVHASLALRPRSPGAMPGLEALADNLPWFSSFSAPCYISILLGTLFVL